MSKYAVLQYCVIEYLYVNSKYVINVGKSYYGVVIDFPRNIQDNAFSGI